MEELKLFSAPNKKTARESSNILLDFQQNPDNEDTEIKKQRPNQ